MQSLEQRPTEGSWRARLPGGGEGPLPLPLSSSLSSPSSTQRLGRRAARAAPTSPTVPKLLGAPGWEPGGVRKKRRRRAPQAPWTQFRNPPPLRAVPRLGPSGEGARQDRSLARSPRRTAPAWRLFPPGVRTGRAAPPSFVLSLGRPLEGAERGPRGSRSPGAASAGFCREEGKVASGCWRRRTPAAESRIRPRRRSLGGRGEWGASVPEPPPGPGGGRAAVRPPPSPSGRARQTLEEEGPKPRVGEGVPGSGKTPQPPDLLHPDSQLPGTRGSSLEPQTHRAHATPTRHTPQTEIYTPGSAGFGNFRPRLSSCPPINPRSLSAAPATPQ